MTMCKTELGIDTFSFYSNLTPKQKSRILEVLRALPGFQTKREDYIEETYEYTSDCFADQGVKLMVFRKKKSVWGLFVVLHPTLLLGDHDRSALYHPKKKVHKELMKQADSILKRVHVPCKLQEMKLYRVDVTANLVFEDSDLAESYLRILKKGLLLPHYHLEWFRKNEHKAKDIKAANTHSYKQACKSAAFFSYDKTAQLEMIGRFPDRLIGKRVLRLEVQLRRKGIRKWVCEDDLDNCVKTLRALEAQAGDIIRWYLHRMELTGGIHVRYEDAAAIIGGVKHAKTRARMLYLLRKTSDSRDLTAALEKLKKEFDLSGGQIKRLLKKFRKCEISPITLPNAEPQSALKPIGTII